MSDEQVTVTITAKVNDEDAKNLQALVEDINNNSTLNLEIKTSKEELEEAKGEIEELDGKEVESTVEVDDSQIQNATAEVEGLENIDVEVPVGADTEEAEEKVQSLKDDAEGTDVEVPVTANEEEFTDKVEKVKSDTEKEEVEIKVNADTSGFEEALSAVAGSKLAEFGVEVLDRAGSVQDSWNKLALTFDKTGVSIDNIKQKQQELSRATGKSGSAVREWFNIMGVVGITNVNLLSDTFERMSGRAYQTGTSVENLEGSIQRMVLSGNAGARMLTRMGISSYQLADAMGVTNDEYVKVFKSMSVEERLQALNKAMGDGTRANEMYKHSWEGLKERASIAFGALLVQIGKPTLEMLNPMVEKGVELLKKATEAYEKVPEPLKKVIGVVLASSVVLATVASTLGLLATVTNTMGKSTLNLIKNVSKLPKVGVLFETFNARLTKVFGAASTAGKAGAGAGKAAEGMKATSVGLKGIGQGAMSMLAPLLQLAIVIAVMIPVVTLLVAELLICVKGIQLLIDALDFGSVDLSSAIKGIKQIGQALAELTGVMAWMVALTGLTLLYAIIRFGTIFGIIIDPLELAVNEAKKAFKEINKLSGLKIDKSIPDNLKNLQEALKAVCDSLNSLGEVLLTGFSLNILTLGGILGDLNTALEQGVKELKNAVKIINTMDFDDVDESKIEKIAKVAESLVKINEALGAMADIQWTENVGMFWIPGDTIEALEASKEDLIKASVALQSFGNISEVPQDVGDKLKKLADSLSNVSKALGAMSDVDWEVNIKGFNPFKQLVPALRTAKTDIIDASKELVELASISDIPDGTDSKIQKIADTSKKIVTALKAMTEVDSELTWKGGNPLKNLVVAIRHAKDDIKNASSELVQLGGIAEVPEGADTKIQKIIDISKKITETLKSFTEVDKVKVDLSGVADTFKQAKESISKVSLELQGLTLGDLPEGIDEKIKNLKSVIDNVVNSIKAINEVNNAQVDFDGITNIINSCKDSINTISNKLSELKVENIDESVVESIKKLSDTVKSISNIINDMSSIEDKEYDFDKIGQTIEKSLQSIKYLSDKIQNDLKEVSVDEGISENIKKVSDTLTSIVSIIDSMANVQAQEIDFNSLGNVIESSINSIKSLGTKIAELKDISVEESVPETVKRISTTSQSVVDAINTMNGLTAVEVNYENLKTIFGKAKDSLSDIGNKLNELNSIELTESPAEKIKMIADASRAVTDAINSMTGLTAQNVDYTGLETTFGNAKNSLVAISNHLKRFNELEIISDTGIENINKVREASQNAVNSINTMNGITQINVDFTNLSETFGKGISAITSISGSLNTYGQGDYSSLPTATTNLTNLKTALDPLINVANMLISFPTDEINTEAIGTAITNIQNVSGQLSALSNLEVADYSSMLNALTTTLESMKATLASMAGDFTSSAQPIGQNIVTGIKNGMADADSSIKGKLDVAISNANPTATGGGKNLGTAFTSSFKSNLKLADVMKTEMENVKRAVQSGIDAAKQVASQGAQAVVQAFKSGAGIASPGDMYRAMAGEMDYIEGVMIDSINPLSRSAEKLANNIVDNFGVSGNYNFGLSSNSSNNGENYGSPTINIYVEGDINDDKTMDKLVDRLTRALTWSNATGNRSV